MPRRREYGPAESEAVAQLLWQALWGEGENVTTPLARLLAADRAARKLAEAGYLLDPLALRQRIAEQQQRGAKRPLPMVAPNRTGVTTRLAR